MRYSHRLSQSFPARINSTAPDTCKPPIYQEANKRLSPSSGHPAALGFGVVLQRVVDHGLNSGSGAALIQALVLFLVVVTVMAASEAARVYLVTWIGERVVADIRKAVFTRALKLEPAFFRSGSHRRSHLANWPLHWPLGSDLRNMLVQLKYKLKNAALTSLIVTISRPKSTSLSAAASLWLQVTPTWSAEE